jgi:hypothetical protein
VSQVLVYERLDVIGGPAQLTEVVSGDLGIEVMTDRAAELSIESASHHVGIIV